jgi:DNA repair exonuclease SbcCD ATPase subunit
MAHGLQEHGTPAGAGDQQTAQTAREWVKERIQLVTDADEESLSGEYDALRDVDAYELADMHDAQKDRADRAEESVHTLKVNLKAREDERQKLQAERDQLHLDNGALRATIEARTAERDAAIAERDRLREAIENEPELPGDMPDELWAPLQALDRKGMELFLQWSVKQIKANILARAAINQTNNTNEK